MPPRKEADFSWLSSVVQDKWGYYLNIIYDGFLAHLFQISAYYDPTILLYKTQVTGSIFQHTIQG
jgi:hypothetical protein